MEIRKVKLIFIFPVKFYQKFISPMMPAHCRYVPTCSQYCVECIEKLPIYLALWYSLLRILKCNQFFPGGYDPVPEK
jgi:putative membrane protein insertion efficiency factor